MQSVQCVNSDGADLTQSNLTRRREQSKICFPPTHARLYSVATIKRIGYNQVMQPLAVDRHHSLSLQRQLFDQLSQQIRDGILQPGERLLPSRELAHQLSIGRITVMAAYRQLQTDGYVVTRVGAGTFVADLPVAATAPPIAPPLTLSTWGTRAVMADRAYFRPKVPAHIEYDFGFGRSFPHTFPYDTWRKLLGRYLSTDDTLLSRYGSAAGFAPLRAAIAEMVARRRGVHCTPEQIVIVNGMQQAVDVIARLLITPGDDVLVESPGYTEAYELFTVYGAHLRPIPVTTEGIDVATLPEDSQARLIFVTPTNQFPRGGMLPLPGKLALLNWAARHDTFILEDDYDSELHYSGDPPSAMQALDQYDRVIYLGTFSKVLFPALRLAYVILPQRLVPPFLAAKRLIDRGSPTLTQAAIADFIVEGHFELHMRRLRRTYRARRAALVQALQQHTPLSIDYAQLAAGLHVMVRLPDGVDEARLVRVSAENHTHIMPGAPYHLELQPPPSVLLGFSNIAVERIEDGVREFGRMLSRSKVNGL